MNKVKFTDEELELLVECMTTHGRASHELKARLQREVTRNKARREAQPAPAPRDRDGQPLLVGSRVRSTNSRTGKDYPGVITWIDGNWQKMRSDLTFYAIEVTRDNGNTYVTFTDNVILVPANATS